MFMTSISQIDIRSKAPLWMYIMAMYKYANTINPLKYRLSEAPQTFIND